MSTDDEETVRINVEVPESVRETAKQKLSHGGISREVRDRLHEIAFGPELAQRSRLERQRASTKEELQDKREERREIDADIETLEGRVQALDEKLASITTKEDKYEAKLEELEASLREDGMRLDDDNPNVQRAASTGGVEPEGVLETLKERNPDVPAYAFTDGLHDRKNEWNGVEESEIGKKPDEREGRYR